MCGPVGYVVNFPPRQALPDGYEVWGEWGEIRNGETGIGAYCWVRGNYEVISDPFATRWEARRDAIRHAAAQN
jgi:hypothetical protein